MRNTVTLLVVLTIAMGTAFAGQPFRTPGNPSVVYVNLASRTASPDGGSWGSAYASLAEALQSDLTGKEEIWVARGTYAPTRDADRHASFTLVSGIGLYGGFSGRETRREQRNWKRNPTVLTGEIGDPDEMGDNVYHVVTGSDDAILDGFTIRDGYAVMAEGETDDSGCLVAVPDAASAMEILRIVTNIKNSSGAGLLNLHAGTVTRNCRFTSNFASKGGAVYNMVTRSWDPSDMAATVVGEPPSFETCIFEDNHATGRGGAVNNDFYTASTFVNCIFAGNRCDAKGGALYADMGSPVALINVLFRQNEAERGAALVADGVSPHRMVYATFVGNIAYDIGAALYQGTYMGDARDGEAFIGNEVHLYKSIVIGNDSESSSSSISNWHDCRATHDGESIVETEEGSLTVNDYLNPMTYASRSKRAGWRPDRKVNTAYWTERFENDPNRTYTAYAYDTASVPGTPAIIYVDDNAIGHNDGTSWPDAYTSLSVALENAILGSQIWVAAGTYKPTTGTDRSQAFVMKEGVAVYGGFAGTESNVNARDYNTYTTTLSGDIGTVGDASDNSYHVLFGASGAVLDGFVVQGGNADGDFFHSRGAGLLCYDAASPDIANCTFQDNTAVEGGAIACYADAAPTITNCLIAGNTAENGGALLFRTGPDSQENGPKIVDTFLSDNIASDRGGAVYIDYGAWPGFDACTISGNASTGNGGGVYVDNNASQLSAIEARFTACDLVNNLSGQRGGAFAIYEGTVFLDNSTITENFAATGGGGIALDYMGSYVNMDDSSTITDNTATSGENDIDDDSTMGALPPPMAM
ncbi:right-handed parallel beta-helix repeat-containing protein [Desulfosarcina alkanivorans]|nr:right-handed parallel beta-helix repeat-containing protein [Desulfosarcina alkanivorans]